MSQLTKSSIGLSMRGGNTWILGTSKAIRFTKENYKIYLKIKISQKRKIFTKEEEILLEDSFKENRRPPAKKYTEM